MITEKYRLLRGQSGEIDGISVLTDAVYGQSEQKMWLDLSLTPIAAIAGVDPVEHLRAEHDSVTSGRASASDDLERRFLELFRELDLGDDRDPRLYNVGASLDPIRPEDGRFVMAAELDITNLNDETLALATEAMRQVARGIGMLGQASQEEGGMYDDILVAGGRETGLSLVLSGIASSSLDTDGDQFRPGDSVAVLTPHNLYSRKMQIVLLVGLVALAQPIKPHQA